MKIKITALMVLLGTSLYSGEGWLTNIEKAQELAKTEKKLVLLEFTGSDWCPPCKALKKNVFDTDKFKAYAKKNLVLVELDFPRDKSKITKEQSAYNGAQAKKFAVRGYPTVILLDADGKELTKKVRKGKEALQRPWAGTIMGLGTGELTEFGQWASLGSPVGKGTEDGADPRVWMPWERI